MLLLIPLLPFLGFVLNSLAGRRLPRELSGGCASMAMLGAFGASVAAVRQLAAQPAGVHAISYHAMTWFSSGDFDVPFTLRLDPLSSVMVLVVTGIGFLIHVYSTGYMHEERPSEYARYFSYLNLFAAFMLLLVLAANFLVMFVGWEGVGLCSYLLIGFWYQKPAAADAGKKAFIVNRVGDVAFILGVLLTFVHFGTLDFQEVAGAANALAPDTSFGTVSAIALLLFIGATGKSAQIPLYVWLPDAMEGPTPVSALIHAATMVTAGVYLIGRNAVLFAHAPQVLLIVAMIGAATALWAGALGLVQNDIKRVLAYSTVSQLGYMFLAMGVGAYGAGIFHLFTHAFFKALLFLGSGAVIHALAGEQDLRRMGGLKHDLPVTYWTFLVGALAIAGIPGLAGFFSKDEILFRTFASGHQVLWIVGTLTSFLTAVYMFRLVFMAFHGPRHVEPRDAPAIAPHGGHLHDAPPSMAVPLVVLAFGSIVAGYLGVPAILHGANRLERFLAPSFEAPSSGGAASAQAAMEAGGGSLELALMIVASILALAGIALAARFYLTRPGTADRVAARFPGLYRFLLNKGYVDEIYDEAIVQPVRALAEGPLWRGLDVTVIDGAVNGIGAIVVETGGSVRKVQTGSMRAYAVSVLVGVVTILGYYVWR
ncbi:MAG TPA: NADH-quinone oxidoreductase subunit L [Vicinamibacterales bacterium]|nr:NADH-quinone oxidoreductase subunit L [Vicinamibacterales bacterium]